MEERKENIVLFPFMAKGHIIPSLALALQIEKKGYQVTFINTVVNIKNIKQSLPPSSSIRLLQIPFNSSDHGLPPDSDDISGNLMLTLLDSSVSLKPQFRNLLSDLVSGGESPVCVVSDVFLGWTAEITHEFGIFHAIFSGAGGFGLGCYYSLWMNLPHRKTESMEFRLPDFPEAGIIHVTQLSSTLLPADGDDHWSKIIQYNLSSWVRSDGILFNTVVEIDKIGLNYFRRKFNLPVWAIGPLLHQNDGVSSETFMNWLDQKPPRSVLFVSFGSQNTISASQTMKLAKALESSGKNFIWVVRPPLGFDINAEFEAEEWLPEGFVKRVGDSNRGIIVKKWAPQMEILSHKSVAAFMSHCGWNSVLESLSGGVVLIGWPMAAEQFYNVMLLEEVGVCVEVARGTHFEVRCEDIVEKIEVVMGENRVKGNEMRKRAWELKEMMEDAVRDEDGYKGSSVKAMDEFFSAALQIKEKSKVRA